MQIEGGCIKLEKIFNEKKKRVCDLSEDHKVAEIIRDGCLTRITADTDGTLRFTHSLISSDKIKSKDK